MGKKVNINSKSANKQTLKTEPIQLKVQLLQMALAEAIDQNEIVILYLLSSGKEFVNCRQSSLLCSSNIRNSHKNNKESSRLHNHN
jgi:hypothetical protein